MKCKLVTILLRAMKEFVILLIYQRYREMLKTSFLERTGAYPSMLALSSVFDIILCFGVFFSIWFYVSQHSRRIKLDRSKRQLDFEPLDTHSTIRSLRFFTHRQSTLSLLPNEKKRST